MRKAEALILLALGVALIGTMCGCGVCPGVMDTAQERNQRIVQESDLQMRMIVDDFDRLMLLDKSSRLMPWYSRVGF